MRTTTESRPFTAATDHLAFAQAFTAPAAERVRAPRAALRLRLRRSR